MKRILQLNGDLIYKTLEYSVYLEKVTDHEDIKTCFNALHNFSILSYEQIDFYNLIWSNWENNTNISNEQLILENGERINETFKGLFISIVSQIEFQIKHIINKSSNHPLQTCLGRSQRAYEEFDIIYSKLDNEMQNEFRHIRKILKNLPPCDSMGKIIDKSKAIGLINEDESVRWKYILELRNITVHNNCIASRDFSVYIQGNEYQLVAGTMTSGNLDLFLRMSHEIVDLFFNWINKNIVLFNN